MAARAPRRVRSSQRLPDGRPTTLGVVARRRRWPPGGVRRPDRSGGLRNEGLRGRRSPSAARRGAAGAQSPRGVVVHRTRTLTDCDIYRAVRPPCTTVARSVVDSASWARSDDEARTVVAMVFQQQMTTVAEIAAVLDRMPRAKRRKLVLRTSLDAAGGAHSLGELTVLRLVREAGLPEPTSQHVRRDASGRRRYLDLYWKEWGLHVEIDGAHHLDPRQAWLDVQRQNELWIGGDRALRFPGRGRARPAA